MITELYDNWLSQGIQEYTTSGNLKSPLRKLMVEWVLESWASLSLDVIKKSFKVFGLNLVDGSDNHLIHCFKEGQTCENGAQMLKEKLLVRHELSLNVNPFTDLDVEDATEDFVLIDESDDEDGFIDIYSVYLIKKPSLIIGLKEKRYYFEIDQSKKVVFLKNLSLLKLAQPSKRKMT